MVMQYQVIYRWTLHAAVYYIYIYSILEEGDTLFHRVPTETGKPGKRKWSGKSDGTGRSYLS